MIDARLKLVASWVLVVIVISGCSGINFSEWRFPYMYPVQQGNYITSSDLAQLKLGMTKEQVVFLLGDPVTQFMFNSSQWQYIFQQYTDDKLTNSYLIDLDFNESGSLLKIVTSGKVFDK